ncbi:GNAT family N-acetyltransferase [Rhodococcus sp. X156]|uniref:GNAT family N-acetyltransferase n=1 Tax=Rhodococcus sp. X156 TaxID=2499145 RepID=UPI001F499C9F|nr:GNAT family N-acetyltransferase [Rhodococcus sp. X156]
MRRLGQADADEVVRGLGTDPVANCMVLARVEAHGVTPNRLGAELWTVDHPGRSLCYSGANLIPVHGSPEAVAMFAELARRQPRACSSLVGMAHLVLPMWELLEDWWGPAREVRARQPLLALPGAPLVTPDPHVRRVCPSDLPAYLPASVAMFIEEMGIDPTAADGGAAYRRRVVEHIAEGRAYARFEDGAVVYKAEVGASSSTTGQIQGVWVAPERRGSGLAGAGTAAVAAAIRSSHRLPSLYVNDFNATARRVYERIGFHEVATFATVLLH